MPYFQLKNISYIKKLIPRSTVARILIAYTTTVFYCASAIEHVATQIDQDKFAVTLKLHFEPACHIYSDDMSICADSPDIKISPWTSSCEPINYYDKVFKENRKIFNRCCQITFLLTKKSKDWPTDAYLHVTYSQNGYKFGKTELINIAQLLNLPSTPVQPPAPEVQLQTQRLPAVVNTSKSTIALLFSNIFNSNSTDILIVGISFLLICSFLILSTKELCILLCGGATTIALNYYAVPHIYFFTLAIFYLTLGIYGIYLVAHTAWHVKHIVTNGVAMGLIALALVIVIKLYVLGT